MGEIDKTTQGNPEEATPSGKGETTPNETPQTYTQEQVDKAVQSSLTKAGRDAKTLETQRTELTQQAEAIEATKTEIERTKQEQEAAFMESIKNNPDAVDWATMKKGLSEKEKALKAQEATFAKKQAEYDGKIKAAEEAQKEINIFSVASAKKVDSMRLKTLSDKFGITDKEKLEELADEIIASVGTTNPTIEPDPGTTKGGSSMPSTAKGKIKAGWEERQK